jgi:1-phosphofructokinase family hexose kinase
MILTVTVNPLIDKTYFLDRVHLDTIQRVDKVRLIPGGKGVNVSRLLKTLGSSVDTFVVIGGESGEIFRKMLEKDGQKVVAFERKSHTRYSTTAYETGTGKKTTFIEESHELSFPETESLEEEILKILPRYSHLVLSGSFPGPYTGFYADIIKAGKKHGVITLLDSYGDAFLKGVEAAPFFVKPNRHEFESAFEKELKTDEDYLCAFQFLALKGIELIVISDGANGFRAYCQGRLFKVTPPKIDEVNAVGSGDAVVASIVHGLKTRMELEDMFRLAAAAGCANAARYGVCYCSREMIEEYIDQVKVEKTAL